MKNRRHRHQFRTCTLERLENRCLLAAAPASGDLLVNSFTYDEQRTWPESPAAAATPAGDVLTVFSGRGDGDDKGVFARRLGEAANGEAFRVNTTTAGEQFSPTVAVQPSGEFLVAWSGRGDGDHGDIDGVFLRRFNANGRPISGEVLVNSTVPGSQRHPALAVAADGSFAVAWSGNGTGDFDGIFLQRFASDASPIGDEIRLNTRTDGAQRLASLAADSSGRLVAAWSSLGQDGDGWGVFGQRLAADGSKLGREFRLNSTIQKDQFQPKVASADDGRFVAVWTSLDQDGDAAGVFGQRFDAAGRRQGDEFRVNTTTALAQQDPQVSAGDSGRFIVSWSSMANDSSGWNVFVQEFDAQGDKDGGEVQVNVATAGPQQFSSLALADAGAFAVAWSGMGTSDRQGVFLRRFDSGDADSSPPALSAALANDTAAQGTNSDRVTSDPTVAGTATDASEITLFQARLGDGDFADVTDDLVDGRFRFNRARLEQIAGGPLADGRHVLLLKARDEFGNTSGTTRLAFTLDTTPPPSPTGLDLAADSDTGTSDSDNLTSDVTPTITVDATTGSVVRLRVDGQVVGEKTAASIVEFDTGPLAVGEHVIRATATDAAGNTSPQSSRLVVTVDATAPSRPRFDLAEASDTAPVGNQITRTQIVTLAGRTSAGARVRLLETGATGVADSDGEFTFPSVTLSLGANRFTVRATDDVGNRSEFSRTITRIDAPVVVAPIANRRVNEDAPNLQIDLSNTFLGEQLTLAVHANDNPSLVGATLSNNLLTLDFAVNRHGTAKVTIRATDNGGQTVDDTFRVVVTPVNDRPSVVAPLPDVIALINSTPKQFNLSGMFGDVDNAGTVVRFNTSLGRIRAELFDDVTPLTVANFLAYANDTTSDGGNYDNTIFHRSVASFVVQGGGFKGPGAGAFPGLAAIDTDPDIDNEFRISNTRGTIAMAKLGSSPNSATSQFFFSLRDNNDLANPLSLDNQNGGFTVFGRVLGSGMEVADAIGALPRIDLQPSIPANLDSFQQVPLRNYTQANANSQVPLTNANMALVNNVTVDPSLSGAKGSDNGLTLSIAANSNPGLVTPSFNGRRLNLQFAPNQTGTALITVRALDADGLAAESTIRVLVPQAQMAASGAANGFAAADLRQADLTDIAPAAAARWAAAGLDAARLLDLARADIRVADLPAGHLALTAGNTVWIDADAAGHGWFVDATPADDAEFTADGSARQAAAGKMDLLSVVAHELGHVLGLADLDAGENPDDLMAAELLPGQRHLPGPSEVDLVFAQIGKRD